MFSCAAAAADNRDLVEEIFHELRAFPLQFHNTQGEVKSRDYQGRVVYAHLRAARFIFICARTFTILLAGKHRTPDDKLFPPRREREKEKSARVSLPPAPR